LNTIQFDESIVFLCWLKTMLLQISKKGTIILVLLFVITNSVFSFSHKLVTKSDRKIERLLSLTRDESVHDLQ